MREKLLVFPFIHHPTLQGNFDMKYLPAILASGEGISRTKRLPLTHCGTEVGKKREL